MSKSRRMNSRIVDCVKNCLKTIEFAYRFAACFIKGEMKKLLGFLFDFLVLVRKNCLRRKLVYEENRCCLSTKNPGQYSELHYAIP